MLHNLSNEYTDYNRRYNVKRHSKNKNCILSDINTQQKRQPVRPIANVSLSTLYASAIDPLAVMEEVLLETGL